MVLVIGMDMLTNTQVDVMSETELIMNILAMFVVMSTIWISISQTAIRGLLSVCGAI
jgi:hypothetical protein